jgi:hypothetical protein
VTREMYHYEARQHDVHPGVFGCIVEAIPISRSRKGGR